MSAQELVQIRPLELEFPYELNKEVKCSFHVENKSDGYIAFKVQSTDPKKYRVKPNHGLMEPGSDFSIVVTLNPQTDAPPNMNCKDKFQVKTVIATESTILNSIKDVTNIMKGPGKVVHEVLLPVTYLQNQVDREGSDANIVPSAFMRGGQQKPETIEEGEEEEEDEEEKENEGVFLASNQNASKLEELFRKEVHARKKTEEQLAKVMKESEGHKKMVKNLQQKLPCIEFKFEELKKATNDFAEKLGEGGFGEVYKGVLHHTPVAIKKMKSDDHKGFNEEIVTLSIVRHPNLVTLIGACRDNESLALVYEYLPGGSLEDHLNPKKNNPPLSGQNRINIALEICSALCFLHSTNRSHGDIKPDNILLDSNYGSKLSDFGTCRQLQVATGTMTETTTLTPYYLSTHLSGTLGYMDPEYLSSGVMTPRFDVYSFGLVLLRLATGKDLRVVTEKTVMGIIEAVETAIEDAKFDNLADASVQWPFKEMPEKMGKLGLKCFLKKRERPSVAKLFESLKDIASNK